MEIERRRMIQDIRLQVFERDNYTCRYCGSKDGPFHADHVYPWSRGGETSIDNLVTACRSCNGKKGAKVGIFPLPLDYLNKHNRKAKKDLNETKRGAAQIFVSLLSSGFYVGLMLIVPLSPEFLIMKITAFLWFGISAFYAGWWIVDFLRS